MDVFRRTAECLARQYLRADSFFKRRGHILYLAIAGLLLLLVAGGCATTADDDSDLPWNVRQPWEGAPSIPGMQH